MLCLEACLCWTGIYSAWLCATGGMVLASLRLCRSDCKQLLSSDTKKGFLFSSLVVVQFHGAWSNA
jgi:hypothetical protein